jgi:hypothetical protein
MTTRDANVLIIQTIKNFIDPALEYREECYLPKNKFGRFNHQVQFFYWA